MGNFTAAAIGLASSMATLVTADATNNAPEGLLLARSPIISHQTTHVERLSAEPETEKGFSWAVQIGQEHSRSRANQSQQGFSWVAQVGRTPTRLSQMQLDSRGFSWVTHLEAEAEQNLQPIQEAANRVMNEKHREKVGAEAAMPDTPKLRPLFGKNPAQGKHSKQLKEKAEKPRAFLGISFA